MKKLIILLLITTVVNFSQSWNSIVETDIPTPSFNSKIDLYSNKDGMNVIVQNPYPTSNLKYYLLNSSGTTIRTYTFESQAVQFAGIDGDNDKIYVVYKLGDLIKTRKSSNAGQNWANMEDIDIGSNTCNNVDINFSKHDNALHVVWATQDDKDVYKTYYSKLSLNDEWSSTEEVTDGSNVGGFPTVSNSEDRVHVGYNTKPSADPWYPYGDAKSRDKLNSNWQSPQTVFSNNIARDRIHAGSSKLFDFYYKLESGPRIALYVKERNFNDTWSSTNELIQYTSNPENLLSAANSYDNKTHIVYEISNGVGYRSYNGSWSSESEISTGYGWISPKISSVSNDLYVVWGKYDDYLYYRQYDAAPLTPSNFAGTTHSVGWNAYPKITWSAVNEPDVRENANGIKIQRSLNGASFTDLTTISGTSTSFIDYGVGYAGSGPSNVRYKIQSVDLGSNTSDWTSIVQIQYGDAWKAGSHKDETFVVTEYNLNQNFPNPFNPQTTIQYDVKEKGFVQLKVYDMLGNEVADLVNENKESGRYFVDFIASSLPSGVYIYSLRVNDYFQNKKMTILK